MADLIGKYTNRLEDTGFHDRKCISAPLAPGDDERKALERRRSDLAASLEPDPERARKVLIALLGSFPSFGEDEATARFILSACCRACARVPAWAVEDASARFLEGRVNITWSMATRPTPPQILAEASHSVLPVEAEIRKIGLILEAEIVDTETTDRERQDALDAWAKLKSEIGHSNVIAQRTDAEIAAERAEMKRANERFRPALEADRKSRIAAREAEQAERREA